jgi:hypothetical protein
MRGGRIHAADGSTGSDVITQERGLKVARDKMGRTRLWGELQWISITIPIATSTIKKRRPTTLIRVRVFSIRRDYYTTGHIGESQEKWPQTLAGGAGRGQVFFLSTQC